MVRGDSNSGVYPLQAKLEMKVMYKPPATAAPASGAMGATGASPTEETQGQAPHI